MSDRTDWTRVLRDALDGNVAGNAALDRLLAAGAAETQTLRERLAFHLGHGVESWRQEVADVEAQREVAWADRDRLRAAVTAYCQNCLYGCHCYMCVALRGGNEDA